jgi:hypothetical protein
MKTTRPTIILLLRVYYRGNVSTGPLPSNDKEIFTEGYPVRANSDSGQRYVIKRPFLGPPNAPKTHRKRMFPTVTHPSLVNIARS